MADFYELRLPEQWGAGKWKGKWAVGTVYSFGGEKYGYLYPDLTLHDYLIDDEGKTVCFFETEWDCHHAAIQYYHKHGQKYPYMAEWTKLSVEEDESESEVMEFI